MVKKPKFCLFSLVEVDHDKKVTKLEIEKAKQLAKIESDKFETIISSIGQKTLIEISNVIIFLVLLIIRLDLNSNLSFSRVWASLVI